MSLPPESWHAGCGGSDRSRQDAAPPAGMISPDASASGGTQPRACGPGDGEGGGPGEGAERAPQGGPRPPHLGFAILGLRMPGHRTLGCLPGVLTRKGRVSLSRQMGSACQHPSPTEVRVMTHTSLRAGFSCLLTKHSHVALLMTPPGLPET